MSLAIPLKNDQEVNSLETKRTIVEIEYAFLHLMYQFRQIDKKYGLMIREEINAGYENRREEIEHCQQIVVYLERESLKR